MEKQSNLFSDLAAVIKRHFLARQPQGNFRELLTPSSRSGRLVRWLMPNGGTILLILLLVATQPVWARSLQSTTAASTNTISYQGRLADAAGNPLTGVYNMEFRVYNHPTAGTALWTEFWTGGNSVQVSDGLFNVMLGSINPALVSAIQGQEELYLGITVDTDTEMMPRIQLGSVPFSMQALTVTDGSITTAKVADGAITASKLAPDLSLIPAGTIVMWSGSIASIPTGWALCDGTNGTPDLRDRFVVGAGNTYAVGATGGVASNNLRHSHTVDSHTHGPGSYGAAIRFGDSSGGQFRKVTVPSFQATHGWDGTSQGPSSSTRTDGVAVVGISGAASPGTDHQLSTAVENRPPYYSLAYIMKLP
jgi:microcystin-dependent protein